MMEERLEKLPEGWVWTRLGEICSNEKNKGKEGSVPYLEIGNIDISTKKYLIGEKPAVKGALVSRKGDILISQVRPTRGAITINQEEELQVSSALTVLKPFQEVSSTFMHYYLAWNGIFLNFLGENSTGTMYPTVKEDFILGYSIPLPPLPEQHRIVAKVEELFTKLDGGIEALKKVKEQLKRYRQAVLKYAFEGKLTQEWREANKEMIEPASVLLDRIKEERKKEGKGKPKEMPPVDTSELPELPEGWAWVRIEEILDTLTDYHANGSYKKLREHVELLNEQNYAIMIRTTNLENRDFKTSLKYISESAYNFLQKSKLLGGEIIIGKIGNAGKVYWMPNLNRPCSLGMNMFLLRFNENILTRYVYSHLLSSFSSRQINSKVKGVGNPTIDKLSIRSLLIALPSLTEQQKLVEEIESRLSVANEVERVAEQSLKQSNRLRQSILKRAFEGKLVPQDPTDEPASMLLERIRLNRQSKDGKLKIRAHRGSEWVKTS